MEFVTKSRLERTVETINDHLGVKVLRLEYTSGKPQLKRTFADFERSITVPMTKGAMLKYLDAFLLGVKLARATGIWSHGK